VAEDVCHFGDGGASGVERGFLIAAVAGVIVTSCTSSVDCGERLQDDVRQIRQPKACCGLSTVVSREIKAPRGEEAGWGAGQGVTASQPQPKREPSRDSKARPRVLRAGLSAA
jgi:hypothetical protein